MKNIEIVKIDVSLNARTALKKKKKKKGGINIPALFDEILIKQGLLNKDGSLKE